MKLSLKLTTLLAPVFAIIVAFGLSTIMLYLIGEDPIETFKLSTHSFSWNNFSDQSVHETLTNPPDFG